MLQEADFQALLLIEKAPPGMEPVVRKLKKKNVDNPFAVAWAMYNKGEAVGAAGMSAVLKDTKKESRRPTEAMSVLQATDAQGVAEGPKVRVALITEGLGNKRDMNYYGPEAVQSAPQIFEGKPMMINHMGEADDRNRPEGDVEKTVGYYKNLHVEKLNGKLACVGECHFDLTQEGLNAYQKAKTAIHYHNEFGLDRDYVGISINAGGRSETRVMTIDGKREAVNYILGFEDARSADMVTLPARGGTFLALVESVAGARMHKEATRMETLKRLDAALAALTEAEGEKDSEARTKKIVEARSQVDSLKQELVEAAKKLEEGKGIPKDMTCGEDEDESESETYEKKEAKKRKEDKQPFPHDEKDEDEDESETKKESNRETMRLAVRSLISESKLNPKYFDEAELAGMSLSEAKKEIARTKRVHEATAQEMVRLFGEDVSAAHPMRESAAGGKSAVTRNEEFPVISA